MCGNDLFCGIGRVVIFFAIILTIGGTAWFLHEPGENETPHQEIQKEILRPRSILWYKIVQITTTSVTPAFPSTFYPPSFDVTMRDSDGNTALHRVTGDGVAMREIIQLRADVNAKNNDNDTALHIAASRTRKTCKTKTVSTCLSVINLLVEHGAELDARDKKGNTFLHILFDDYTTLTTSQLHQIVMDYGHFFNVKDNDGRSVLAKALRKVKFEISTLSVLHKEVVDFKLVDSLERSLLFYAVEGHQSVGVLYKLIEFGANYMQLDNNKASLLHWAVLHVNLDAVAFSVKRVQLPLNINEKTTFGSTPLHFLGEEDISHAHDLEIVRLLLKKGADKTIQDHGGMTPYDYVKMSRNFFNKGKVLELLA